MLTEVERERGLVHYKRGFSIIEGSAGRHNGILVAFNAVLENLAKYSRLMAGFPNPSVNFDWHWVKS